MAVNQHSLLIGMVLLLSACVTTNQPSQPDVRRITPEALEALIPAAVASYSLEQLVVDAKQAKTADEIIEKIKASDSRYDLSVSKILELSQQGVDTRILDYIQNSNNRAKQNYIAEEVNKANKGKDEALKRLNLERTMQMMRMRRYYDPFFYPYQNPYYLHPFHRRRLWRR